MSKRLNLDDAFFPADGTRATIQNRPEGALRGGRGHNTGTKERHPESAHPWNAQQGDGQGRRHAIGCVEQDRNEIPGYGIAPGLRASRAGVKREHPELVN